MTQNPLSFPSFARGLCRGGLGLALLGFPLCLASADEEAAPPPDPAPIANEQPPSEGESPRRVVQLDDVLSVRSDGAQNEAHGIKIGDTARHVQNTLGKPKGIFKSGQEIVWMYDLGTVNMKNDQVTGVRLMSREEVARQKAEREKRKIEEEMKREEVKIAQEQEGMKELDRVLADEKFAQQPPTTRLSYWRTFARRYPALDVSNYIEDANEEIRMEREMRDRIKNDLRKDDSPSPTRINDKPFRR